MTPILQRSKLLKLTNGDVDLARKLEQLFAQSYDLNPTFSSVTVTGLSPGQAVQTDATDTLVSVPNTGTGSNVLADSPTIDTPTLVSSDLTGTPTAPTQAPLDNSTKVATTAYADLAVAAGLASLPPSATSNNGTAVVDFGAFPGSNFASVAVAQPTILGTTSPSVMPTITDETAAFLASFADFGVATVTAGVGFTIAAYSPEKLEGTIPVRWAWS